MTLEELRREANALPSLPGVYLMRDQDNRVIYVGKAKKLKNRVSQYFQDSVHHSAKTRKLVGNIHRFEVIVAANEFEALVLECSLIKRYMPKYNILLKDGKGYPFVRLDMQQQYPKMEVVNQIEGDKAEYFGPFGSRGVTNDLIQTIVRTLKLPDCSRKFPRDIGKERPCLNYHMNQCAGWCRRECSAEEYRETISKAKKLLSGDYRTVLTDIKKRMMEAAQEMQFESAASLRDQMNAIEALGKKQLVTTSDRVDTDVIGYAQTDVTACFAVLHFNGGVLFDKDYELFPTPDDPESAVSSLLKQYYLMRSFAPKKVLLPFVIQDADLYGEFLLQKYGKKTTFLKPQRGDNAKLVALANRNAAEEAQRVTDKESRTKALLQIVGKMLAITPPDRIEAYDISNISGTDIVGGMIVFQNGKPRRGAYRKFKIEGLADQDDYGSMRQMLVRRFTRYIEGDSAFGNMPDLVLIDGGVTHAKVVLDSLTEMGIQVPIFGMVKDDRHRTRALVTPNGEEIKIDNVPSVYSFVGNIQEETHNYAIGYHKKLRSKRLRCSELDQIPGIGEKRKKELLAAFQSVKGIAAASLYELERYLPKAVALSVYEHFRRKEEELCE